MSSRESLTAEVLDTLSRAKTFRWTFTDIVSPSLRVTASVSCMAFSVEVARQRLLSYLEEIEGLHDERRVFHQFDELWKKNNGSFNREDQNLKLYLFNQLIKKVPCFLDERATQGTPVIDYSRSMKILYQSSDGEEVETTLGEMLSTTEPLVIGRTF